MEESLKILLNQIITSISDLRIENNTQNENVNLKLDTKIDEINNKIDVIKENMITENNKEDISIQKLTIIIGAVSSVVSALTAGIIKVVEIVYG
jgi:hypothetical protein